MWQDSNTGQPIAVGNTEAGFVKKPALAMLS